MSGHRTELRKWNIVSNDKHFKVLKDKDVWPKVDLETLEEYHKHLMSR